MVYIDEPERCLVAAVAHQKREADYWLRRSAEAEHREILAAALLKSKAKSFAEVLASMPNVGRDADFARTEDDASPNVLG